MEPDIVVLVPLMYFRNQNSVYDHDDGRNDVGDDGDDGTWLPANLSLRTATLTLSKTGQRDDPLYPGAFRIV
jgi:hypothetical protein